MSTIEKGFHPYTSIKLIDNSYVFIKDLNKGDTLSDGSIVETVITVTNKNNYCFYTIKNNNIHIFVCGLHYVFDNSKKDFVKVCDYKNAGPTVITYNSICSVLTDTHYIKIENEIFKDW